MNKNKYAIGQHVSAVFKGNVVSGEIVGEGDGYVYLSFETSTHQSRETEPVVYCIDVKNILS